MSRARDRKAEETLQFLQQNPEVVEHETQVSVEKNGIFEMVASDGENPLPLENDVNVANNKVTYLDEAQTLEGTFFARDLFFGGEDGFGGEDDEVRGDIEIHGEDFEMRPGEAEISLSKNGIGVLGEDEPAFGEDGPNPPRESSALDDDEVFGFLLDGTRPDRAYVQPQTLEHMGDDGEYGLSGVNIEFEVLNNKSGTVTLVMFDTFPVMLERNEVQVMPPEGPPLLPNAVVKEVEIGSGEKGRVDDIGFFLAEGELYDGFEIFVDGGVQIGLVGVDYSTEGEPPMDMS